MAGGSRVGRMAVPEVPGVGRVGSTPTGRGTREGKGQPDLRGGLIRRGVDQERWRYGDVAVGRSDTVHPVQDRHHHRVGAGGGQLERSGAKRPRRREVDPIAVGIQIGGSVHFDQGLFPGPRPGPRLDRYVDRDHRPDIRGVRGDPKCQVRSHLVDVGCGPELEGRRDSPDQHRSDIGYLLTAIAPSQSATGSEPE